MKNISSNVHYRTTNASDYITNNQEYQVFPDGIRVAKVVMLRSVPQHKVLNTLYQIGYQYLALNEHLTEDGLINLLHGINNKEWFTLYPMKPSEIIKIVKAVYLKKHKEGGYLEPMLNYTRKVIFKANTIYTKQQQVKIIGMEIGQVRRDKAQQIIYDAIENWELAELITQKKIKDELGWCLRKVKTYWPEIKQIVKDKNKVIKAILETLPFELEPTQPMEASGDRESTIPTIDIESTGPTPVVDIMEPIADKQINAEIESEIATPKEDFNDEQKQLLADFNPIDELPDERLKLEFGKTYLERNAEKISIGLELSWEFHRLVYGLSLCDIEDFENMMQKALKDEFDDYCKARDEYVNEHTQTIGNIAV